MDAVPPNDSAFTHLESLLASIHIGRDAATDAVAGKTHYDGQRHVMARLAYLDQLILDQDVRQQIERWRVNTGLARLQEHAVDLLRHAKSHVGAEAWATGMARGGVTMNLTPQVRELREAVNAFFVAWQGARTDDQVAAILQRDAGAFVQRYSVKSYKKHSMDWPWLPGELIDHFWDSTWRGVAEELFGVPIWRHIWLGRGGAFSPALKKGALDPRDGESASDHVERLRAALVDAEQLLRPIGKAPSDAEFIKLRRGSTWLYRHVIVGQGVSALADEYKEGKLDALPIGGEGVDPRRQVSLAMERAADALSWTPVIQRSPPEPD